MSLVDNFNDLYDSLMVNPPTSGSIYVDISSASISAPKAFDDIQSLLNEFFTNHVSFLGNIPNAFQTIQNDIRNLLSNINTNAVSFTIKVGLTADYTSIEFIELMITLNQTYSFDVPGLPSNSSVQLSDPTLGFFVYNPSFNETYAKAVSKIFLSANVELLGVNTFLQVTVPSFEIYAASSIPFALIGNFLGDIGCTNKSLNDIFGKASTGDIDFIFGISLQSKTYNLRILISGGNSLEWHNFQLENVSVSFSYILSTLSFSVAAKVGISDGDLKQTVNLTLFDDGGGGLTASAQDSFYPGLDVNGVANHLSQIVGVTPPEIPFDLLITFVDIQIAESGGSLSNINFQMKTSLVLNDSGSSIQLNTNLTYIKTPSNSFDIQIFIGELELVGDINSPISVFSATTNNSTLSIGEIAELLSLDSLKNFSLFQNIDVGGLFLASDTSKVPKSHLMGLLLVMRDASISSPMIDFATGNPTIGLTEVTILAASDEWAGSGLSVPGFNFPTSISKGMNFSVSSEVAGSTHSFPLIPTGQGSSQGNTGSTIPTQPNPMTANDGVRWFDVNKQLGSIGVNKIGFKLANQTLELATTSSITIGPLSATLDNFSFDLPLSWNTSFNDLNVNLDGLTIAYNKPPLTIDGGLLHKNQNGIDLFVGNALIETSSLSLGAIGEYAEVSDANGENFKSLALFAVLSNPPLGGPVFCFVTGLAFGFGYNSALQIPATAEGVPNFPLLEAASPIPPGGQAPTISTITNGLLISKGENWVALGILFRSFEFIESTVLLTAAFGHQLQFAILGQSNMSLPPANGSTGGLDLAFAQVDVEATYSPQAESLEVFGILTNNSYILSKDCHLTGGFAYILKPDGNFVLTFGGYSPHFNYQQYNYPSVPRVGINWSIDSHTSIKGDEYFAITPALMMAGGGLQATWHSGIFSAWFNLNANLTMHWQPFQYAGSFNMQLGVTFQLHFWFVNISFSFHIGVGIDIQGPPFSGVAHIDLDVISFSIHFGAAPSSPPPLDWNQFRAMLPKGGTYDATTSSETSSPLVGAKITNGLLKDLSQKQTQSSDITWSINGTHFEIDIFSSIPILNLSDSGSITGSLPTTTSSGANIEETIGILPMKIFPNPDEISSNPTTTLEVSLSKDGVVVPISSETDKFSVIFSQINMATAHWGTSDDQNSPDVNKSPMLMNSGLKISGERGTPNETLAIPVSNLQTTPQVTCISSRRANPNPFV